MIRNLNAEMARHGLRDGDIALEIGKTVRSVHDKISGKYPFHMSEAVQIRDKFFPGMTLEYLFADVDEPLNGG